MPTRCVRRVCSLLFFAVTACNGSTDPEVVPGVYALASIDGVEPPVIRLATIECDYVVTGATLTIGPADSATLDVGETYDCSRGGGQVTNGGRVYPSTFALADRTFTLTYAALGAPQLQVLGTVQGDGSTIDLDDPADYAAGAGLLRLER